MRKIYGQEEPLGLRMVVDGQTVILPNVFDPSELRSDVTGKVCVPHSPQCVQHSPKCPARALVSPS